MDGVWSYCFKLHFFCIFAKILNYDFLFLGYGQHQMGGSANG
jgi:hypothetical protein